MSRAWFGVVLGAAAMMAVGTKAGQFRPIDAEREIVSRFGFTPEDVEQARGGQAVVKMLPAHDGNDIGVFGAIRIDASPDRLVSWVKDVAAFRTAAQLGFSRRLTSPPRIEDFAELSLDSSDLDALERCRPGSCDLKLGDKAIKRFQGGVDWTSPDAAARASSLTRELMLGQAQAYLKGGDRALGASHNERAPRLFADEFHQALWQSKALYDVTPELATYLERFPAATLPGSEQFLYWAKGGGGPEASISLHQMVVYRASGGAVLIVDKLLYASRYLDAALVVMSLAPAPEGKGFYALVGARGRSTMLSGIEARLLRGRVESATRDSARMYLDWIRACLAA